MAIPEKPLGDRSQVQREVSSGIRYAWVWIPTAVIALIVIWFVGFGWGSYGGWWWGGAQHHIPATTIQPEHGATSALNQAPAPPGTPATSADSGVQILASNNRQALVGQPFAIQNVPVQNKPSSHAFWISQNNSAPMLVTLTQNTAGSTNNIKPGANVNITGVVERAPSAAQAKRLWSLTNKGANQLEQQGAYVQATGVRTGP